MGSGMSVCARRGAVVMLIVQWCSVATSSNLINYSLSEESGVDTVKNIHDDNDNNDFANDNIKNRDIPEEKIKKKNELSGILDNLDAIEIREELSEIRKLPAKKVNWGVKHHYEKRDRTRIHHHGFNRESIPQERTENHVYSVKMKKKGLLVIPGLGRSDRLDIVVYNIKQLAAGNHILKINNVDSQEEISVKTDAEKNTDFDLYGNSWDCLIYIYAEKENSTTTDFWSKKDELDYLRLYCDLVENPNKMVTENLFMVQPKTLELSYKYVFILLDDCRLLSTSSENQNVKNGKNDKNVDKKTLRSEKNISNNETGTFDLSKIIRIMEFNNLTLASPLVMGANTGGGQLFRTIMQKEAMPGTEGYVSVFVELFAWILTVPAYHALSDILYPTINPYGWGYDFWYDNHARKNVHGHKMGIVSTVKVRHEQESTGSGLGRTDDTSIDKKWRAVLRQEKYFKTHRKIDLKSYRETLNLRNSSWNGAVTGYLYDSI